MKSNVSVHYEYETVCCIIAVVKVMHNEMISILYVYHVWFHKYLFISFQGMQTQDRTLFLCPDVLLIAKQK